jgi:Flp pilus assembly protein TadG
MAMGRTIRFLWQATEGSAAMEMALVAPVFFALMFGAYDLGAYFMSEHVVVQAVRDGSRFAGRQAFWANMCSTPGAAAPATDQIINLTRTGTIGSGGTARLGQWTDGPGTITVTVRCDTDSSTTYGGIYAGSASGVPVVTVTAKVPYGSLFKSFGIGPNLSLNASAQSVVMGI